MQDRSSQVPHRSGLLKQTNKKHKTGGHRSKVIISVLLLCDKLSIWFLRNQNIFHYTLLT